jgi:hypothetical protein
MPTAPPDCPPGDGALVTVFFPTPTCGVRRQTGISDGAGVLAVLDSQRRGATPTAADFAAPPCALTAHAIGFWGPETRGQPCTGCLGWRSRSATLVRCPGPREAHELVVRPTG